MHEQFPKHNSLQPSKLLPRTKVAFSVSGTLTSESLLNPFADEQENGDTLLTQPPVKFLWLHSRGDVGTNSGRHWQTAVEQKAFGPQNA